MEQHPPPPPGQPGFAPSPGTPTSTGSGLSRFRLRNPVSAALIALDARLLRSARCVIRKRREGGYWRVLGGLGPTIVFQVLGFGCRKGPCGPCFRQIGRVRCRLRAVGDRWTVVCRCRPRSVRCAMS